MARKPGSLSLSSNIEVKAGAPLDARLVVPAKSDLTIAESFEYSYIGMIVSVQSEGKAYLLKAKPSTTLDNWGAVGGEVDLSDYYTKEEVDNLISSVFKPAGSIPFEELPELSAEVLGNVYSITNEFTTDNRFVEGPGETFPIGTNVVVVDIGTELEPDYKFDVLPGFIDLSGYQEKIQFDTLPVASEELVGKVYQYIGETSTYTHGYFYECVEDDSTNPATYSWEPVPVQEESSGGGSIENPITSTVSVGGITSGTTYIAGTPMETLWRNLLSPTLYPTLTGPSASISATGAKLLEVGSSLSTTMTITFNRGSINPAYGTSGYRSGVATSYALNGGTSQGTNQFVVTVDSSQLTYQGTVAYEAGEQPKDSVGDDYSTPLAAGSVNTNTISYEFVNALWANTESISSIAKLALVSKTAGVKTFVFPSATIANPEVFDVPASWTVTHVEVLNTLSNTWEDCSAEFTKTYVMHDDAAGTAVSYERYTCNLGYAMGSRQVRIKWS